MSSYQGIGEASIVHSVAWYLRTIRQCYDNLVELMVQKNTFGNQFAAGTVLILGLFTIGIICVQIVRRLKQKNYVLAFESIFLIALIPVVIYCMALLGDDVVYHQLMLQSSALLLVFSILLIDKICLQSGIAIKILSEIMVFILLFNMGNYIVGDNIAYMSMSVAYEKTYALAVRMVDRVEQLEGWDEAKYLYVAGNVEDAKYCDQDLQRVLSGGMAVSGVITYANTIYVKMINQHVGGNYDTIYSSQEIEELISSDVYQEMPIWPQEGCAAIIDDVIVIKLE